MCASFAGVEGLRVWWGEEFLYRDIERIIGDIGFEWFIWGL